MELYLKSFNFFSVKNFSVKEKICENLTLVNITEFSPIDPWGLGIGDWGLGIGDWGLERICQLVAKVSNHSML